MKTIVVLASMFAAVLVSSLPTTAKADVGGCYSIHPICMPGQAALCMCDQVRSNCFWVCK